MGNEILLERNGKKEPVLRGSTIAGRLRHAFMALPGDFPDTTNTDKIFGSQPYGKEDDNPAGCLTVEDAVLDCGKGKTEFRMHHLRDRHKGRVVDKGLFAVEMCPPGTQTDLVMWLKTENNEDALKFARVARAFLERGMVFGGNGNRGLGLAKLKDRERQDYHRYNLADPDDYASWLDARDGDAKADNALEIPQSDIPENRLRISLEFKIPEGQDIIVGEGAGETRQAEPSLTVAHNGKPYWTIPGSAFHGMLRQWVTRLAARDGKPVADSTHRYNPFGETDGDMFGWCFDPENPNAHENCPVARLFGSLHKAGRVHCTGAFASAGDTLKEDVKDYAGIQERTHVAIDPISGGAVNHMLFQTAVLTSEFNGTFKTDWYIQMPSKEEAQWIGRTIAAMDMGLIRIGSSKASGRLKLVKQPDAYGIHAEAITGMAMGGGNEGRQWGEAMGEGNGGWQWREAISEKAYLIKGKKYWEVKLKTKKGSATFPIYNNAKYFREEDAEEGAEVNVIRPKGAITKVTIEGKPETAPEPGQKKANNTPHATKNMQQASPEVLGEPFYNPYTFVPFPKSPVTAPMRHTPLSADDNTDNAHLSGMIRLKVKTESPLMSHDAGKANTHGHKTYQMLKVGPNVIVPGTSVKGFLRNLTTILSGGPLNMLDEHGYLCQGRHVPIQGVDGKAPFLAQVVEPGDVFRDGTLQLGESRFISTLALARQWNKQKKDKKLLDELQGTMEKYEALKKDRAYAKQANDYDRKTELTQKINSIRKREKRFKTVEKFIENLRKESRPIWVLPNAAQVRDIKIGDRPTDDYWRLKISGQPVQEFNKREGLFKPNRQRLTIPSELWAEYASRNMHGTHERLQKNDLVWLQVTEDCKEITEPSQILSLQWARWGKIGDRVIDRIHDHVKPDWISAGAKIHPVTNMFGLGSPNPKHQDGLSVASKLRFGNLVFGRNAEILSCQPIATLASPHPGCLAFYRNSADPKSVSSGDYLKGYKVYRTTEEKGKCGPWSYNDIQPIFEPGGKEIFPAKTRKNAFSSELLAPGAEGDLEIAFRSLTKDELSLLIAACKVPWRLGGGKSLGLGLCSVADVKIIDEFGEKLECDGPGKLVDETQLGYWIASQKPVNKLRYPRAANTNNRKTSRGGHNWFSKMAKPKQGKTPGTFVGLMPIYSTDELKKEADNNIKIHDGKNKHENVEITPVSGTVLPQLDPNDSSADRLYGYDLHFDENKRKQKQFNSKYRTYCYPALKKFND
ncbi:MAG: hypothetical protein GY737_30025 [Desulfobacteraceae bacterium]|nr:hypothetical protein [Desulfobacteraceae bacterium]